MHTVRSLGALALLGAIASSGVSAQDSHRGARERALYGREFSMSAAQVPRGSQWLDLDQVGALIDQFAATNAQSITLDDGRDMFAPSTSRDREADRTRDRTRDDWWRVPVQADRVAPPTLDAAEMTTVPEPSTYLLVAAGLMIIVVLARRRPERARRSQH